MRLRIQNFQLQQIGAMQEMLKQYLESIGHTVKHNRTRCPIHGGSNPSAFEIKGDKFRCHSCGAWGDIHDLTGSKFAPIERPLTNRQRYDAEKKRMAQLLPASYAEYWFDQYAEDFWRWEDEHCSP